MNDDSNFQDITLQDILEALSPNFDQVDPVLSGHLTAYVSRNSDVYHRMTSLIAESKEPFNEALKSLRHDFEDEISIVRQSTSTAVWRDYLWFAPWVADAVHFLMDSVPWLAYLDIFKAGAGHYPMRGRAPLIVENVEGERRFDYARAFVQNSVLEGPRSRDDMLFYLFFLGRYALGDVDVGRMFAVGMSKSLFSETYTETPRKAKQGAKPVTKGPAWTQDLFTPHTSKCRCALCVLKSVDPDNLNFVIEEFGTMSPQQRDTVMNERGAQLTYRYLLSLAAINVSNIPDLPFEIRVRLQGAVARIMGAPMTIDREEMLRIASDPDLWRLFTTWGETDSEIDVAYVGILTFCDNVISRNFKYTAKTAAAILQGNFLFEECKRFRNKNDFSDKEGLTRVRDKAKTFIANHRELLIEEGQANIVQGVEELIRLADIALLVK